MSQWGRKQYPNWPSRSPVWTQAALIVALLCFALAIAIDYARNWSFLQKFYLPVYVKTWFHGWFPKAETRYRLIATEDRKGQARLAVDGEVDASTDSQGEAAYVLTEEARRRGLVRLAWQDALFNDKPLHAYLRHWIYRDQTVWDYIEGPAYAALGVFIILLPFTVPKDRRRALVRKHGRRLRGPELVTTTEFNTRQEADGMAFKNEERTRWDRLLRMNASRWVRVPRHREAMHFLVVGDSGMGKSSVIRQILVQIWERGETAIVYDPAREFLPQFYSPARGDVTGAIERR